MEEQEKFKASLRAAITMQFERVFVPKLSNAHINRIVMFEVINCSAETGYTVNSLDITRGSCEEANNLLRVNINDRILLDFHLVKTKEVPNA